MKNILFFFPLFLLIAGASQKKKVAENPVEYMPGTDVLLEDVNTSPNPTPSVWESEEAEQMTIKKIDNPVKYQEQEEKKRLLKKKKKVENKGS